MNKLYSYFTSLSFILLVSTGAAQSMEVTMPTEIPSLKQLCLDYISQNTQHVNLIDNLVNLPSELAIDVLSSTDGAYIHQNKATLINLAQSNVLSTDVECFLAKKYRDVTLAYEVAKHGPITGYVASMIIENFINTDVTTCLTNFENTFHKAFPKEILGYGNDGLLLQILMSKITENCYPGNWATNNKDIFVTQDFEQNVSKETIINYTAKKYCKDYYTSYRLNHASHVTLSPCKNFLAFIFGSINIYNLKTGSETQLSKSTDTDIDKIVFSQGCSHLGLLDKNGDIHSIEIASVLFKDTSLQKIASLAYCHKQSLGKSDSYDCESVLNKGLINEEKTLIEFIDNNLITDIESFPIHIHNGMKNHIKELKEKCDNIVILNTASEKLGMTKKEIVRLWAIDPDREFMEVLYKFIRNNFGDTMQINFHRDRIDFLLFFQKVFYH